MAVTTIDFDAEWDSIVTRLKHERQLRVNQPVVKLYDGNWTLRGRATHIYRADFREIEWDTGIGVLEMPEEYYLSKWVADHDERDSKNVHITVEKDGIRWSGRMDYWEVDSGKDGRTIVRVVFKHDYEEFNHILVWANPFLPAEIQFPKLFLLFGQAKWCLKVGLFCQLLRLEEDFWMMQDDPLEQTGWDDPGNPLTYSNWSIVVKPDNASVPDVSPLCVFFSRFKSYHSAASDIGQDAQLTPVLRRWLYGDEEPWEGAGPNAVRNGCLVVDFEDKSGWLSGTSFGGNLFVGLIHAIVNIGSDGMTEGIDIMDDPAWPEEYYETGWKGTLPQAPGIVFRQGEHTGIQTSKFTGSPAKDVQHVTGGHSMPGVNELISAAIQMAGDLIAAIIGIPPVGGAVDAILKPLYTDVFLAFMAWKDMGRVATLGNSRYHERWAEGADRAYTLSALIAMRTSLWVTRETFTHTLTVADGLKWIVGQRGKGHFYLGDRIGSTAKGTPKGKIYVDRVTEIGIKWDRSTSPIWEITIGQRKQEDPVLKALKKLKEILSILVDLGVL